MDITLPIFFNMEFLKGIIGKAPRTYVLIDNVENNNFWGYVLLKN